MRLAVGFLLALLVAGSPSASAGSDSQENPSGSLACVIKLRIPRYPPIARFARLEGTADATVELGEKGAVRRVKVTGVGSVLQDEVESNLLASEFSPTCSGSSIRLVFSFVITGDAEIGRTVTSTTFESPNRFVLLTAPAPPMTTP